jgi:CelD/BcsL family acetyltransferase involved in cellulose biosynthesis
VRLERLHINGGPVLATGASEQEAVAIITDLLGMLAPRLASRQAIYVEGVCLGSAVDRAMTGGAGRSLYHVLEPTDRYERRLIRFPASYDEYMQSRKSQTRKNLRNTQHKLERHLDGNVRLVCCAKASEVPEFVRRAVAISRKTYQWNLLGLGLRDSAKLENTLAAMAKHGWTRCYLLECEGTATAFMIGYLYEGTYYYVDVGFDPEWEKWSVGTILHLEVLRDLMDRCKGARSFDFSSGSGVHKKRFANDARAEANYLLLPRSFRNRALIGAYRITDAVGSGAVRLLEALGIKAVIKKMVRRHAMDAAAD